MDKKLLSKYYMVRLMPWVQKTIASENTVLPSAGIAVYWYSLAAKTTTAMPLVMWFLVSQKKPPCVLSDCNGYKPRVCKEHFYRKKAASVGQNGRFFASCNFFSFWLIKTWGTTN